MIIYRNSEKGFLLVHASPERETYSEYLIKKRSFKAVAIIRF